ncbi:unnamed protein product [Closterium sp. Naga37s-1]|nr:unnamed protein product [Closterium sp. Naga37s-1]
MHPLDLDAILAKQDTTRMTFEASHRSYTRMDGMTASFVKHARSQRLGFRGSGERSGERKRDGDKRRCRAAEVFCSEEDRQAYFSRRELTLRTRGQATTIQELLDIRASRSEWLRERTLATAVGVRIRNGQYTDRPAILAFVFSKVHPNWLPPDRLLPARLEGEGSLWCDLDVLEFACLPGRQPARDRARAEEESSELVDDLRGCSAVLGPGSQVACDDTFVTMGPIVVDSSAPHQLGFLTNCHVAGTSPEMSEGRCLYHPHCPSLGPGVPIGEVRRVVSFRSDLEWFGFYINHQPDIRVRVDGAFAAFTPTIHAHQITALPRGLPPGTVGPLLQILPAWPVTALVSQQVAKVGRSSGLTRGTVMAYAVEYYVDSKRAFASDLLIRSSSERPPSTFPPLFPSAYFFPPHNPPPPHPFLPLPLPLFPLRQAPFDLEGDAGSTVYLHGAVEEERGGAEQGSGQGGERRAREGAVSGSGDSMLARGRGASPAGGLGAAAAETAAAAAAAAEAESEAGVAAGARGGRGGEEGVPLRPAQEDGCEDGCEEGEEEQGRGMVDGTRVHVGRRGEYGKGEGVAVGSESRGQAAASGGAGGEGSRGGGEGDGGASSREEGSPVREGEEGEGVAGANVAPGGNTAELEGSRAEARVPGAAAAEGEAEGGEWRPLALVWGGTGRHARVTRWSGKHPEYWTTAVDLHRLMTHLHVSPAPPSRTRDGGEWEGGGDEGGGMRGRAEGEGRGSTGGSGREVEDGVAEL